MNKVILMGRLTKDPEVRYSQGGAEPVCIARYTLAVNRRFKREGEPDADFINCVAFTKQGEFAEKFFKKGMLVAVTGRLQIRTFDDPQTNQRKWMTEIILEDQYFAESKATFEARNQGGQGYQQPTGAYDQPHGHAQPAQKPQNDIPPDFFIDQDLNDEDLPF